MNKPFPPSADQIAAPDSAGLFRSFWMAGYEGADHFNSSGFALSMNDANQHWQRLEEDYKLLAEFGIRTVRESIGWRITESQGCAGMQRLQAHAEMAERHGIEVIWTLMHYGWPEDIEFFSAAFLDRFAAFSKAVATTLREVSSSARFFQPVNEISFFTWALSSSSMMRHPLGDHPMGDAGAVKRQLVRAALRACEVISTADPRARYLHSDPVIYVEPRADAPPNVVEAARLETESAFEAWDMLCGRREPELGGSPRHLDVVGINYYHSNQWELESRLPLHWHLGDARRKPFSQLVASVWQRYRQPIVIAETSHVGVGRAQWLDEIASEVMRCREQAMDIQGLCLYPIIDRHGWEDFSHWHNSGLWDLEVQKPDASPGSLDRIVSVPYAQRLRAWQKLLPGASTLASPSATQHPALLTTKPL